MKNRYGVFKWFWNYSFKHQHPDKSKLWVIFHGIIPCFKFMCLYETEIKSEGTSQVIEKDVE